MGSFTQKVIAELIESGDRANYEFIMDAVTHQPLGRLAAMKGGAFSSSGCCMALPAEAPLGCRC